MMWRGKGLPHLGIPFCVLTLAQSGQAAEQRNEAALPYVPPSLSIDYHEPSEQLLGRFLEEVSASDSMVFDRLAGPSSRLGSARQQSRTDSESLEKFNRDGASLFGAIGVDSLRSAAMEILPLDVLQNDWEGRLAGFIAGTFGNPEEERIHLTSGTYSAVRTSWERKNESSGIQWGLRPWRTSPYIYFLAQAGHLDGRSLLTFEGRAGYTILGAPRLEGRLAMQLPRSFRLAGGTSVNPCNIGGHQEYLTHVGVTLERVVRFTGVVPDGVFYIGFRSGAKSGGGLENLLVAGLSKKW